MEWSGLISKKMGALGLTRGRLSEALSAFGHPTTAEAIRGWLGGRSAPKRDKWPALVELLEISEAELKTVTGVTAALREVPPC